MHVHSLHTDHAHALAPTALWALWALWAQCPYKPYADPQWIAHVDCRISPNPPRTCPRAGRIAASTPEGAVVAATWGRLVRGWMGDATLLPWITLPVRYFYPCIVTVIQGQIDRVEGV